MSTKLSDLAEPFFAAAAEDKLVIPQCRNCHKLFFYPTVLCSHCHHLGHDWVQVSGRGAIYSFTELYSTPSPTMPTPYTVAVIELDEGVRLMSNIVDAEPGSYDIGTRVEVRFGENFDGQRVPRFTPSQAA